MTDKDLKNNQSSILEHKDDSDEDPFYSEANVKWILEAVKQLDRDGGVELDLDEFLKKFGL